MDFNELHSAAEFGDLDSQYAMARMYLTGDECVSQDLDKACHWFLKAGEQGCSSSQAWLAYFYCINGNRNKAEYWAEKALENGHSLNSSCLESLGYSNS
jgi:TPR repeat protein